MTPAQQLRAKRNEVIPPILEMGCQIKSTENGNTCTFLGDVGGETRIYGKDSIYHFDGIAHWKILGKPTSIGDLLRMLGEKYLVEQDVGQDIEAHFAHEDVMLKVLHMLDLSRGDNVELQEEEVIKKLVDIL